MPAPDLDPAPPAYLALALQVRCQAVNGAADRGEARGVMAASIARIRSQLMASKAFIGPDLKLAALPEYVLTGFPMGESLPAWRDKAALDPEGPEYEALAEAARAAQIFLAGNAYETDPAFPELYFQASFVIDPGGAIVLRYRRLVSLFAPSPWDVIEAYVAAHGEDSLFPVADTAIGRLGAIASEEILYPEVARALAVRGAEVLVHASSETGSPRPTQKAICRQARAIENQAAVVSANTAGIDGIAIPRASTDGGSAVIDHRGHILAEAGPGESMAAFAEIDIAALRRARRRPGMNALLARQPLALWARALAGDDIVPGGELGDGAAPDRAWFLEHQRRVIGRRIAAGRL